VKYACWILLALGLLALLCSIIANVLPSHHLLGYLPIAWWRLATALGLFAIALKVVAGECSKAA
jgi:hypothetical protein